MEVVLELFLEVPLRHGIGHASLLAVGLVHLPCNLERDAVFLLENIIGVQNEVVEIVRGSHHVERDVTVIPTRIFQI